MILYHSRLRLSTPFFNFFKVFFDFFRADRFQDVPLPRFSIRCKGNPAFEILRCPPLRSDFGSILPSAALSSRFPEADGSFFP